MTGPEHYKAAQALLDALIDRREITPETRTSLIATAQVHATLALAAATAAAQATAYDGDETHSRSRGWAGVA